MTSVSNDPIWWPTVSYFLGMSYFEGSWRTSAVGQRFDVASQLYASLLCYTIGVRRIMNIEIIFDVPIVFSSTDIRTRGGLM
jgi:hypothetical protein